MQKQQRRQQGGEAQAAIGYAPWESAEEREQDMADMERILQEYRSGSGVEEAVDVAAAVCSLCDGREGEVTGDCKAGYCERLAEREVLHARTHTALARPRDSCKLL